MGERNVYMEPEDRILLRTADVYQTDAVDDVDSYSDTLLSVVANFDNSGRPEGFNAQSMVGKSKKGEVACRLFAIIDPEEQVIRKVGFKSRGCLAMTGAASVLCKMIEGKDVAQITDIDPDEIREALDGVPAGKVNTLYFAPCAARALAGDFLISQGATLDELNRILPCDSSSVSCIMAEHCSLRSSRIELQVKEQEEKDRIAENNALADVMDRIRRNSSEGRLYYAEIWEDEGLRPPHLAKRKFAQMVDEAITAAEESDDAKTQQPSQVASGGQEAAGGTSLFANRGVGIPRKFSSAEKTPMPDTIHALSPESAGANEDASADKRTTFDDLDLPEGCTLEEIDGEWVLVQHNAVDAPKLKEIDANGIRSMQGKERTYYYDAEAMAGNFAHWAFLAQEKDPLATFADCVRQESEIYPRPMALTSFANEPLCMNAETVEKAFTESRESGAFDDIKRTEASNGDVYFYSDRFLSDAQAAALAEYDAVERVRNV